MDAYSHVRHLGRGSFGVVELVRRKTDGAEFALKHISTLSATERAAALAEVALLKRLHHPGIVRVGDCIETREELCILTEFLAGGDLHHYLEGNGMQMPIDMVVPLAHKLLEALDYLHSKRVIHRDIKPANILLTGDKQPKLADFGVSKALGVGSLAGTQAGTIVFMAPEVLMGEEYRVDADVWSLGATLYFLLSGGKFLGNSTPELIAIARKGREWTMPRLPARIPPPVSALIARMLRVDPRDRASVENLLRDPVFSLLGGDAGGGKVAPGAGAGGARSGSAARSSSALAPAAPIPARASEVKEETLPSGWLRHEERETGRVFYANASTGEKSWSRPAERVKKGPLRDVVAAVAVRRADVELSKAWIREDKEGKRRGVTIKMIEEDVNARGDGGSTLLMHAAYKGNMAVVKELLRAGADVNLKEEIQSQTALMFASMRVGDIQNKDGSFTAMVSTLLDAGARVNAKDNYGWTALTFAFEHEPTANLLRAHGGISTAERPKKRGACSQQ